MDTLTMGGIIKLVIDTFKPLITNKAIIPPIAIVLGIIIGILSNDDLLTGITQGTQAGAISIGINESIGVLNKKLVDKENLTTDPELEFLASKYNADDTSTQ